MIVFSDDFYSMQAPSHEKLHMPYVGDVIATSLLISHLKFGIWSPHTNIKAPAVVLTGDYRRPRQSNYTCMNSV